MIEEDSYLCYRRLRLQFDGGDCPDDSGAVDVVTETQEKYEQLELPTPGALFPFTGYPAGTTTVKDTSGVYATVLHGAKWVEDDLLQTTVVECDKLSKTYLQVSDVPYGYASDGFTVNFWFR